MAIVEPIEIRISTDCINIGDIHRLIDKLQAELNNGYTDEGGVKSLQETMDKIRCLKVSAKLLFE